MKRIFAALSLALIVGWFVFSATPEVIEATNNEPALQLKNSITPSQSIVLSSGTLTNGTLASSTSGTIVFSTIPTICSGPSPCRVTTTTSGTSAISTITRGNDPTD